MSLATRCSECGTIFRVVADQLKVSEGWVRCGRCDAVFNAFGGLFDLEREAPPDWPALEGEPALAAATKNVVGLPSTRSADAAPPAPTEPAHANEPAPVHPVEATPQGRAAPLYALAQRVGEPVSDPTDTLADTSAEAGLAGRVDGPERKPSPYLVTPPQAPEFVRQAERQARWRGPRARGALALSATLLLAGLALQITHHFRDLLATRFPATRAALTAWCASAGCRIEPLRRIDDIAVESTGLAPLSGTVGFRLSVTLRNRGALELALPAVDLSLTDASGRLVTRRALLPPDFRVAASTLKPGAEAALQLAFSAGPASVTGYTVGIFYP